MSDLLAQPGDVVPLRLILLEEDVDLYPRARIYDSAGSAVPLATIDLVHKDGGYYFGTYTVPSSSKFTVRYTTYDDSGHTTSTRYGQAEDMIIADQPASPTQIAQAITSAQLNVAYDDTVLLFKAAVWMDRGGNTVTTATTATITVRDALDTLLFTATSTTPYTNSVFIFGQPNVVLFDDRIYIVEVSITDLVGTTSTVQTFATVG